MASIIDYFLSTVEKKFLKYRTRHLHNYTEANTLQFIQEFEKDVFRNCTIESLKQSNSKEEIKQFIDTIVNKSNKLKELLNIYASGFKENQIQFGFYHRLGFVLAEIINEKHPAFKDLEGFLAKEDILTYPVIPDGAVTRDQLKEIRPLYTKKAPENIIKGFQWLYDNGYCDIFNIENFVYHTFTFNANHRINASGFFYFKWNKSKHWFTNLIRRLKQEEKVSVTNEEVARWVVALIPELKLSGALRYCSKGKDIALKNEIDTQIFKVKKWPY